MYLNYSHYSSRTLRDDRFELLRSGLRVLINLQKKAEEVSQNPDDKSVSGEIFQHLNFCKIWESGLCV